MTHTKSVYHGAVAAALLATTAAAFAATGGDNDATAGPAAQTTLVQAVGVAEQHTGGNAVRAEYEKTKAGWAYDVEVVKNAKVFDVRVDAASGNVISSAQDKVDHDDERDAED